MAVLCSSEDDTRADSHPDDGSGFVLAHLSDLHFACLETMRPQDFLGKRTLGYLRWRFGRQTGHDDELLTILRRDLQRTKPDHTVITGDLTHLGLPAEFIKARAYLDSLGPADRVTVLPGNHDTYVSTPWQDTFAHWLDYMTADQESATAQPQRLQMLYPTVRLRGPVALICISTARPAKLHLADGAIGKAQLARLETILQRLADQPLFQIVALHHPPVAGVVDGRKCLTDMAALQQLLGRYPVHLVLFGHAHRTLTTQMVTGAGTVPVLGVSSAAALAGHREKRAAYLLYRIQTGRPGTWQLTVCRRIFSLRQRCFIDYDRQHLTLPMPAI
ncbi:MAG: metallophosphoesterase family protein [Desulfopila sp.]